MKLLQRNHNLSKNRGINSSLEEIVSLKNMRIGTVTLTLMYAIFGSLDIYTLPHNYETAFFIRYAIIVPIGVLVYIITYTKLYGLMPIFWRLLYILVCQLGILAMIVLADATEQAYWTYYTGLILIILWGGFVFRLSTIEVILASVTNVILYNAGAIIIQEALSYPSGSNELTYFFNNNFFLLTSSTCAIIGANRFNSFGQKILAKNNTLERQKRKLIEEKKRAEESDKLKSAFLANMSHEIRTPMNAILGFSELLKRHNLDKEKETKYLSIIQTKSNQLAQLIDDIIDVSKIEANQMHINLTPVSLKGLFEDLSMLYAGVLVTKEKSDKIKISINEPHKPLPEKLLLDEIRFTQVITNLVNNAIKFTEEGIIEIGYHLQDENNLLVYVKDTGIGISDESKKVIFERYRQSDDSIVNTYGGTGLGLNISKSLVELMGGSIWFESSVGKGSNFCFTVPYKEAEPLSINVTYNDVRHPYDWSGKSILIVEDEPTNMEYLKILLNDTKAKLFFAENGKEAVNVVETNKVDAIVMDLKMPIMNGFEASKKIKLKHKALPIIAQTAYAMQYDENKALNMGVDAYIKKPIDEKKLFPVLSTYLD